MGEKGWWRCLALVAMVVACGGRVASDAAGRVDGADGSASPVGGEASAGGGASARGGSGSPGPVGRGGAAGAPADGPGGAAGDGSGGAEPAGPCDFVDEVLEARARALVDRPEGPLDPSDFDGVTELTAADEAILDLRGIGCLHDLEVLDLRDNHVLDLTPLQQLTDLRELHLAGNDVVQLDELTPLARLETLDLMDNFVRDLTPLASLTRLRSLNLAGNSVRDTSPLASLSRLQSLDLSRNGLLDLGPLGKLTTLVSLDLSNNQLTELGSLAALSRLRELRLAHAFTAGHLFQDDLAFVAQLQSLESLHLEGHWLDDLALLSALPRLQELTLKDGTVHDLEGLDSLDGLATLSLELKDSDAPRFPEALTSLTLLGGCVPSLEWVGDLGILQSLTLERVNADCPYRPVPRRLDLTPLTGHPTLRELRLLGDMLDIDTTQGLNHAALAMVPQLRSLTVGGDAPLAALQQLTQLEELHWRLPRDVDLRSLAALTRLRTLDLEGSAPSRLPDLDELRWLRTRCPKEGYPALPRLEMLHLISCSRPEVVPALLDASPALRHLEADRVDVDARDLPLLDVLEVADLRVDTLWHRSEVVAAPHVTRLALNPWDAGAEPPTFPDLKELALFGVGGVQALAGRAPRLTDLSVVGSDVDLTRLPALPRLRRLAMGATRERLAVLAKQAGLVTVELHPGASATAPLVLPDQLPHLRRLVWSGGTSARLSLENMASWPELRYVEASTGVSAVGAHPSLVVLRVTDVERWTSGEGGGFPRLRALTVDEGRFDGPAEVGAMPALTSLALFPGVAVAPKAVPFAPQLDVLFLAQAVALPSSLPRLRIGRERDPAFSTDVELPALVAFRGDAPASARRLRVLETRARSLSHLRHLTNLRELTSRGGELSFPPSLRVLDASYGGLYDADLLQRLGDLDELRSANVRVCAPATAFPELPALRSLMVDGRCDDEPPLDRFPSQPQLRWLRVLGSRGPSLGWLEAQPELRTLQISDVRTTAGLPTMPRLTAALFLGPLSGPFSDLDGLTGQPEVQFLFLGRVTAPLEDLPPLPRLRGLEWSSRLASLAGLEGRPLRALFLPVLDDGADLGALEFLDALRWVEAPATDLTPLVANTAFGAGAGIDIGGRRDPCAVPGASTLVARGVTVIPACDP